MSRKIKNFILENPTLESNTIESLNSNFEQAFGADIQGSSLVMFVAEGSSKRLVFAKAKPNGAPDLKATMVSFELPCPPFCGKGGGNLDVNVLTTT
jgi:hypothetical protein